MVVVEEYWYVAPCPNVSNTSEGAVEETYQIKSSLQDVRSSFFPCEKPRRILGAFRVDGPTNVK